MLKSWLSCPYLNKEKGFTLLELVLAMAIGSILFLGFYSILGFTINTYKEEVEIDDILISGQYTIEYIKKEIKQAEKIISIDKINGLKDKYPDNIGFVIMRYRPGGIEKPDEYNYSTYYLKNNKIYRIAENREDDRLPIFGGQDGHNVLAEYAISIKDTNINFEDKIVDLNFVFKGELKNEIRFKTKIFIRCPIVY
jgi:prepilin-type N-terminal cleavage/methylation domain-containing protein